MYSHLRRQTIFVFLVFFAFTLVSIADAQQVEATCLAFDSVLEELDRVDAVLLGRVVRVRASWNSKRQATDIAIDVAVEQAWKGVSGTTVGMRAYSGIIGTSFTDGALEVGDRYVFYVSETDGLLWTDACSRFELPPSEYFLSANDPDEFLRLGIDPVELIVGDDPVYPPIDYPIFLPAGLVCPFAGFALVSFGALGLVRRHSKRPFPFT